MGLTRQCPHLWPRGVGAELRVLLSSLIPRNASTGRPPVSISEERQSALLWSEDYAEGESRTRGGGVSPLNAEVLPFFSLDVLGSPSSVTSFLWIWALLPSV